MDRIHLLGLAIEREWQEANYELDAFPDLARRALEDDPVHDSVTPDQILDWTLTRMDLPPQFDAHARFGQPPITLFVGRKFYIDALFWVDGTTSIHQHGFSGAFQVLAGSSIHTRYAFEPTRIVSPALSVGHLESRGSKLLRVGDVEPIRSGKGLIHALFHLERPSVSLVVRTMTDVAEQPQYSYLRPGLAHDPFLEEPWAMRLVQITKLLETIEHPLYETKVGDLLARSDAHTVFLVLSAARRLKDRRVFDRLLARTAERHGDLVDTFRAVFEEQARERTIIERRADAKDADQRFFLALLLNVRSRAEILRLTGEYFPDRDPVETILLWLTALSKITVKLQLGGTPWEPNAFGLPEMDAFACDALRRRLCGEAKDEVADPNVRALVANIARLPTFRPLFEA
jgi:hypothetical protein